MHSVIEFKDTYIDLASIKAFKLSLTRSNERVPKSIRIELKEEDYYVQVDFKNREQAEQACEELGEIWQAYLESLPPAPPSKTEELLREILALLKNKS